MPLTLDASLEKTITVNTLEINSHAIDHELNEIHISYDEGYMDAGVFVPVNPNNMIRLAGQETIDAITAAESYAAQGNSVYQSIKLALYDAIKAKTGITGAVV
ncbi:MAG: hypothetical protein GKR93_11965 [Gammaproteobacteria bacterium]|nr:hypothetical protein [Gammaproteobacteria bacterium]